jgi:biotin transport system substrate-specific component
MAGLDLLTAFASSAVAFIPGDLVKAGLATAAILIVKRAYPLIDGGALRAARS